MEDTMKEAFCMSELTLDSFGEIMDNFLRENEIQMLLTLPASSMDAQVEDNVGAGSTVQFYILLKTIKPIFADMQKQMVIDPKSSERAQVVDALLRMVKEDLLEDA